MLTGYDDLLRRKRSTFRKIAASLISLGILLFLVAFVLWLPLNDNTTDQIFVGSSNYKFKSSADLNYSSNWAVPAQFLPIYTDIDTSNYSLLGGEPLGTMDNVTSIIIPNIQLASEVKSLELVDHESKPYYASPKKVVGHLPTSANPGEQGGVWLFGHLESPFMGEGSVFWDIPKLQDELTDNNNVNIIVSSAQRRFVYRVSSINTVDQDKFKTYDSFKPTLHVVTCYPRLKYDKRMVVNADLVYSEALGN